MGEEGLNILAAALDGRMKQCNEKPPMLDFGTITKNGSLLTNNFPVPIPSGDFVICSSVPEGYTGRVFVAWAGNNVIAVDVIEKLKPPALDFGVIAANGNLLTSKSNDPISAGKYSAGKAEPGDVVLVTWANEKAVVAEVVEKPNPLALDFGQIMSNGSLKTDSSPALIPQSNYVVCQPVEVSPNDKVLVAWVGEKAVVLSNI